MIAVKPVIRLFTLIDNPLWDETRSLQATRSPGWINLEIDEADLGGVPRLLEGFGFSRSVRAGVWFEPAPIAPERS